MAQLRRGPLYRWDDLWRQKEVRPALTLASGQDPLKGSPQSRLLGLLRTVNNAQTGQRNSTLHWAACRLGEMLTAGELPEARHAIDNLTTVALAIGLPLREANATIRSGLSASGVTSWDSQTQS